MEQVGSTMIKSPGAAWSIAVWIEPEAGTWVGALPPLRRPPYTLTPLSVSAGLKERWESLAAIAGLSIFGFVASRGDEPLFGRAILD